ncbi:MAG: glutathione peroxidase [Candidatus Absconditabacteria bacterium]
MKINDFQVKTASGEEKSLGDYKGKVLLIVNVASKCGLVGQYDQLEELYNYYDRKDFEIIAFPCNQFGNQEPGSNEEIQQFCKINYGVSFKVFGKIDVNGENADPLYKYLKKEKKGIINNEIKWNFTKFLVDKNGKVVDRFSPLKNPLSIKPYIDKLI